MPRTAGSKNKVKKAAIAKVEAEINGMQPVDNVPRGILCKCEHAKDMHYGGIKGHCNTSNCECLEFKSWLH